MTSRAQSLALSVAVVAVTFAQFPAPCDAALSSTSRIGPAGVGPIVIGTTPAQAEATGERFTATAPAPGSSCYYILPATPKGLRFLVEFGTIRRAEVTTPTIASTDGLRVGDSVQRVHARYGAAAQTRAGKYDPTTQTITVRPRGDAYAEYRIVFTARKGVIKSIVAGALPQVEYVEGCS